MDLITRAKNILASPKTEWPVIAGESTGTAALYAGYVVPLAAIPPLAAIIGNVLFNGAISFGESVAVGIVTFVMALVGVYILGLIASKIAPSFGGKDDLVAYAYTASWVAGIFGLVPALALLTVLGALYSLYLLYAGAPVMMSVPEGRAAGYTAVVILVAIGVYIVISILVGSVVAAIIAVH
jgi:hypothetical protein